METSKLLGIGIEIWLRTEAPLTLNNKQDYGSEKHKVEIDLAHFGTS